MTLPRPPLYCELCNRWFAIAANVAQHERGEQHLANAQGAEMREKGFVKIRNQYVDGDPYAIFVALQMADATLIPAVGDEKASFAPEWLYFLACAVVPLGKRFGVNVLKLAQRDPHFGGAVRTLIDLGQDAALPELARAKIAKLERKRGR